VLTTSRKHLMLLLLAVALSVLTGCPSVHHIAKYNEARKLFNETTQQANQIAYASVSPLDNNAGESEKKTFNSPDATSNSSESTSYSRFGLTAGFTAKEATEFLTNYTQVSQILNELNTGKSQELINDNLYSSSLVLKLMADWKRAFYAQFYGIEKPDVKEIKVNDTTDTLDLGESKSLANIRPQAIRVKKVLEANNITIFPRDRFVLEAIDPLIRYDNAYLYALQYERDGKFSKSRPREDRNTDVKPVVEAMAKAEQLLAKLDLPRDLSHAHDYRSMARIAMLQTAATVVLHSGINLTKDGPWSFEVAKKTIPLLLERVARARQAAEKAEQTRADGVGDNGIDSELSRFILKYNYNKTIFPALYPGMP
jgi:hypothetical protein